VKIISDITLTYKTAVVFEYDGDLTQFRTLDDNSRVNLVGQQLRDQLESIDALDFDNATSVELTNIAAEGEPYLVKLDYGSVKLGFAVFLSDEHLGGAQGWILRAPDGIDFHAWILDCVQKQCCVTLPSGLPDYIVAEKL
jgi:hypothetical protein